MVVKCAVTIHFQCIACNAGHMSRSPKIGDEFTCDVCKGVFVFTDKLRNVIGASGQIFIEKKALYEFKKNGLYLWYNKETLELVHQSHFFESPQDHGIDIINISHPVNQSVFDGILKANGIKL